MDPNFQDMNKRTPLHHLVYNSTCGDSSLELHKLLLDYNCKINSLDKYDRSPVFYCFCDMEGQKKAEPLDKL